MSFSLYRLFNLKKIALNVWTTLMIRNPYPNNENKKVNSSSEIAGEF
jgi:hypothetical protein